MSRTRKEWQADIKARDTEIRSLHDQGMTPAEIVKTGKFSKSQVYRILRRHERPDQGKLAEQEELRLAVDVLNPSIAALKKRISIGDKVTIRRNAKSITITVTELHPWICTGVSDKGLTYSPSWAELAIKRKED